MGRLGFRKQVQPPVDVFRYSNWSSEIGLQSLRHRTYRWRVCVVSWLSYWDAMVAFVMELGQISSFFFSYKHVYVGVACEQEVLSTFCSWMAVFIPNDRTKSVRNRWVIEALKILVESFCCHLTTSFSYGIGAFWHRTESNIFLFLFHTNIRIHTPLKTLVYTIFNVISSIIKSFKSIPSS